MSTLHQDKFAVGSGAITRYEDLSQNSKKMLTLKRAGDPDSSPSLKLPQKRIISQKQIQSTKSKNEHVSSQTSAALRRSSMTRRQGELKGSPVSKRSFIKENIKDVSTSQRSIETMFMPERFKVKEKVTQELRDKQAEQRMFQY